MAAVACHDVLRAQAAIDSALLDEIDKIKLIDIHAHPRLAGDGLDNQASEHYLSALSSLEPATTLNSENHPSYILAWKALYDYPYDDIKREHVLETVENKRRLIREKGPARSGRYRQTCVG